MKRILLTISLCLLVILCASCAEDNPYQQYQKAFKMLKSQSSFALTRTEQTVMSENIPESKRTTQISAQYTYQLAKVKGKYAVIGNQHVEEKDDPSMLLLVNSYYTDGYRYSQYINSPADNFRYKQDESFIFAGVIDGIINFPKNVVAKESVKETPEGKMITFEMDSEKYYAYRLLETSAIYAYGQFSSYREPPVYTVVLDQQGRIKSVHGSFCEIGGFDAAYTEDREYTINCSQYGQVELDFPQLDNEDYPER